MKIKLFKKENNFKKKDFELNPNLYWKIVLFLALAAIFFSFSFGYYLFMKINNEDSSLSAGDIKQAPLLTRASLEKALNYFSEREKKSAEIINSPSPIVDPSR